MDEIGRAASALLEKDPSRHVWGWVDTTSDPTSSGISKTRWQFHGVLRRPRLHHRRPLWKPGVWDGIKSIYSWHLATNVVHRARRLRRTMLSSHER